jgi:hypothetical protein
MNSGSLSGTEAGIINNMVRFAFGEIVSQNQK